MHSPYAYRFVTDVVRPGPYRYYSYWEMEEFLKGPERYDRSLEKLTKFIIRLCVFLNTKRIVLIDIDKSKVATGSGNIAFMFKDGRAAEIAAKSLGIDLLSFTAPEAVKFQEGDLLVVTRFCKDPSFVSEALVANIPVLALNPHFSVSNLMLRPIPRGVLFEDKHHLLLIPRTEMAYVSYPISLLPSF